jgi:hypothetical protein|tara:strand:+ start:920 stop:1033 length:114 start_codon:yes stop_codon:yes gene_type:complete
MKYIKIKIDKTKYAPIDWTPIEEAMNEAKEFLQNGGY